MAKEFFVGHPIGKRGNREVTLFAIVGSTGEPDAAASNKIFQYCKRFVHDTHLNLFVIGIRRSRPNARGVIFTPGAA